MKKKSKRQETLDSIRKTVNDLPDDDLYDIELFAVWMRLKRSAKGELPSQEATRKAFREHRIKERRWMV